MKIRKQQALGYHSQGRKGKVEVVPTKPYSSQRDLSLAYSPGVAEPCMEIADKSENVYKYKAKSNLVAVISNGTAVRGLGDIGPILLGMKKAIDVLSNGKFGSRYCKYGHYRG